MSVIKVTQILVVCCVLSEISAALIRNTNGAHNASNATAYGPAPSGHVPYIISLRVDNEHHCSGAIVGVRWIVTAARCVRRGMKAYVGAHSLTDGVPFELCSMKTHDKYVSESTEFDIALLETLQTITFAPGLVEPIALARRNSKGQIDGRADLVLKTTGWGLIANPIDNLPIGDALIEVASELMETLPIRTCRSMLSSHSGLFHVTSLCAMEKMQQITCVDDMGSPLVNRRGELVGIASWRMGCTNQEPTVYTSVLRLRTWILILTN